MKVLTAAQMREVDSRTTELGIPGLILMENAGHRVVELLVEKFAPVEEHRIVVLCGKGNNGGDGLVVARQLYTRFRPRSLAVVLARSSSELQGDAAANFAMLTAAGCQTTSRIEPAMRMATLVIDALLGTGLEGPARGRAAELIHEINAGFPLAKVIAVDLPSGLESDSGRIPGESVRADYTVTFTAPKPCHVLSPAAETIGELRVGQIGSPPELYETDDAVYLAVSGPRQFAHLFQPRSHESNKGLYGHVLAIAGARGKTGAAAMTGLASLRAGAGLATVASAASAISAIASYAPEIMTEPLPETDIGSISGAPGEVFDGMSVVAIGPGLGRHPKTVEFVRRMVNDLSLPMVVDADALNAMAGMRFQTLAPRVLTPHPGEMSRLAGKSVAEIQADRVGIARAFAMDRNVHLVLKGNRTVIAFPDGKTWINPTGSPAMATGGTGDVLTGLVAGLVAQFPKDLEAAILAAVWLHGRAGELGAADLGEKTLIATDLFRYLPEAMREAAGVPHRL